MMKEIHNVNISHQTVLNYADAASKLVKPFVDNYPYDLYLALFVVMKLILELKVNGNIYFSFLMLLKNYPLV